LPRHEAGRALYLQLIKREAQKAGAPPDLADAVAQVESRYSPGAVGGVGEVGLMQIRPETAAMLGYGGALTGLFDPETNVHYGVKYLTGAWRLAKGDLCRTLMKYRAGHGEERMSRLSVEYCLRAREHLAAIGSPLAAGVVVAMPTSMSPEPNDAPSVDTGVVLTRARSRPTSLASPLTARERPNRANKVAGTTLAPAGRTATSLQGALRVAQAQARRETLTLSDYWSTYEARVREIKARFDPAPLRVARLRTRTTEYRR
jgi:hypothetical protein